MFLFIFLYYGFFFSNCRNKFVVLDSFDFIVLSWFVNFVVDFKEGVVDKDRLLEKIDINGDGFEFFEVE